MHSWNASSGFVLFIKNLVHALQASLSYESKIAVNQKDDYGFSLRAHFEPR